MSNASSNWLELPLAPPRWLLPVLFGLTALAMLAIWTSDLHRGDLALPLLCLPPVLLATILLRQSRRPVGRLHFRDDGSLLWLDADRRERELSLHGSAGRGPLRVLRMRDVDGRKLVAIYCRPGNLDAAQQRRLTLWLGRFAKVDATTGDRAVSP